MTLPPILPTTNLNIFQPSLTDHDGTEFALINNEGNQVKLVILADSPDGLNKFEGTPFAFEGRTLLQCPLTRANASALRENLTWLQPVLLGLHTSAGLGDRLGLATPGHVRAIRNTAGQVAPIFAQQSIRENTRTGRTPQQVMDDAMWGVFREGWTTGFGADADHLKSTDDIDGCLAAGFTFFTIDPGEHVDNRAETADLSLLRELAQQLPEEMRIKKTGLLGKVVDIEGRQLYFDEHSLLKAMVKYGRAVLHVFHMYQHLKKTAGRHSFELEVSVDETEQPTSHAEHVYIASELRRLGVTWVSLAPRFVGRFEKGVDYIGDLTKFEEDFAGHAAIARCFGPYKLSLHSGSDKFSIYPIAMRHAQGLVHLKTAGTSYLEALRTIAELNPPFFLEIYSFARDRYETDRTSYHVSARLENAPRPSAVVSMASLLDQFDAREILHVTFGSVLKETNADGSLRFFDQLMGLLRDNPEVYAKNLENHFNRHLKPFLMEGKA